MKVTPEILAAIDNAIEHYGNITQLAKHLGIAHSTILFWKNGKTTNISGQLWINKLRHELRPFMYGTSYYDKPLYQVREDVTPYGTPAPVQKNTAPLVTLAQIAEFDPTIESPSTFASKAGGKTAAFAREVKPEYFALEVDTSIGCGMFPVGTVLLAANGRYAQDGDIVAAKLRDSAEVVIRHYFRSENQIKLMALGGDGKNYQWDVKENSASIVWMYPIIEINIDLDSNKWVDNTLISK